MNQIEEMKKDFSRLGLPSPKTISGKSCFYCIEDTNKIVGGIIEGFEYQRYNDIHFLLTLSIIKTHGKGHHGNKRRIFDYSDFSKKWLTEKGKYSPSPNASLSVLFEIED